MDVLKRLLSRVSTLHCDPARGLWLTLALFATLGLCSCRGPIGPLGGSAPAVAATNPAGYATSEQSAAAPTSAPSMVVPTAYVAENTDGQPAASASTPSYGPQLASQPAGVPSAPQYCPPLAPMGPPGMEMGVPMPYQPVSAWTPPGIAGPWPRNEYLRDGGDEGMPAGVDRTGQVRGLEMEDAVAHYQTVDGQTKVEPTNEVYIYAPRFAAVRRVDNLVESGQARQSVAAVLPTRIAGYDDLEKARASKQNLQASRALGTDTANIYHSKQGDGAVSTALGPRGFVDGFKPFENFTVIRTGTMLESETAFLAKGALAAQTWAHKDDVHVMLNNQAANAAVANERVETVYTVNQAPAHPKLRVIKVASTQLAQPGDLVAFTIRFDNVGNQTIHNVAILDNLSPRMEYLPNTAQSSVTAQFGAQPNEGGSSVLRWELAQPLEPGKGGVVRFTCRVR